MKLHKRIVRIAGIAAVSGLFFGGLMSNSNSSAPSGYTGSPADGKTCGTNGGCHGGGTTLDNSLITTDIPAEGYTAGKEYNITITVTQTGVSKFGFSFTAQTDDGTQQGTLTAGSGTNIVNSKYMSHKPSTTSGTNGMKSWPFKWKAPATGAGKVSFYATGNATDGMSNTSGDKIYNASKFFTEAGNPGDTSTVSVNEIESKIVSLFPNPAQNKFWIEVRDTEEIQVINLKGEIVKSLQLSEGKNEVDISDLNYGVYRIVNADRTVNQTLVKL